MSHTTYAVPLAALVLAGAGLAAADTAGAVVSTQPVRAHVSVSIKLDKNQSHLLGKVASPQKACRSGRAVKLFYKAQGRTLMNVRTATSSATGAWIVPGPGGQIPPGKYYVTVAANKTCQAARSTTIMAAAG